VPGYEVRRVHDCEFCGTETEILGAYDSLAEAKAATERFAGRRLSWNRAGPAVEWPIWADPEDGVFRYYIEQRAQRR
jgi:hypothetical protein